MALALFSLYVGHKLPKIADFSHETGSVVHGKLESTLSMCLAEWLSTLGEEALTLQVLVAFRAFETLAVIVIVKSLYPSVSCLNWEATTNTLGGEKIIPICFTVR